VRAPQEFDNRVSILAATQDIDALPEDRQANDPLISPAPENKKDAKEGYADGKNVWTDAKIREKIN
jgi:hypothetical protein